MGQRHFPVGQEDRGPRPRTSGGCESSSGPSQGFLTHAPVPGRSLLRNRHKQDGGNRQLKRTRGCSLSGALSKARCAVAPSPALCGSLQPHPPLRHHSKGSRPIIWSSQRHDEGCGLALSHNPVFSQAGSLNTGRIFLFQLCLGSPGGTKWLQSEGCHLPSPLLSARHVEDTPDLRWSPACRVTGRRHGPEKGTTVT